MRSIDEARLNELGRMAALHREVIPGWAPQESLPTNCLRRTPPFRGVPELIDKRHLSEPFAETNDRYVSQIGEFRFQGGGTRLRGAYIGFQGGDAQREVRLLGGPGVPFRGEGGPLASVFG